MRILYTLIISAFCVSSAQAQHQVPLLDNYALKKYVAEKENELPRSMRFQESSVEKQSCDLENPDINYVEAGGTSLIAILIDTVGLDTLPGTYSCLNCEESTIGQASIVDDQLQIQVDPGVQAEEFTFQVEFCNPNGCRSQNIAVLATRRGEHIFPPVTFLEAAEITIQEADKSGLPGPLACSYFLDCESGYEGRDQLYYFTTYSEPDNRFVYRSARYSGVDSVCLVLCDSFTVCDTFHYAFNIRHDTLNYPETNFLDDFSYAGPHPNPELWLDSDVYVNDDMGEDPPTVGVATFDGLNSRGRPYGGEAGESDFLTSTYINLSGVGGELHLNYYVQRRGLVDRPEVDDSLALEFYSADGEWVYQEGWEGAPINQPNTAPEPFRFFSTEITPEFRHSGFRFRFINVSDRRGISDTWHLDHVRLSNNQESFFTDVAFTQRPKKILKNYSSMPFRHLKNKEGQELRNDIVVGVYNQAVETLNIGDSNAWLQEKNTGQFLFGPVTLFNGQEANIPPSTIVSKNYFLSGDPTGFADVLFSYLEDISGNSFDNFSRLEFLLHYDFFNDSQVDGPGYDCVIRNDTVESVTVFDNYFAYDDGTAEAGIITPEGTEIAVKFTTAVPDTLQAFRIHIPHTGNNINGQEFTLKVWLDTLESEPVYTYRTSPFYADQVFDTLQGFTTYPLFDENGNEAPLLLPAGDFYLGWEQETTCPFTACIPIGYDRNRPQGKDFIMRNIGLGWEPIPSSTFGGSLMLRAVVGSQTPGFTQVEELKPVSADITVYPNPTRDQINVILPDGVYENYRYEIFNNIGQLVLQGQLQRELSIGHLSSGMYILRLTNPKENTITNKRVILERR